MSSAFTEQDVLAASELCSAYFTQHNLDPNGWSCHTQLVETVADRSVYLQFIMESGEHHLAFYAFKDSAGVVTLQSPPTVTELLGAPQT